MPETKVETASRKARMLDRLTEAGVGVRRFVDAEPGKKRTFDHTMKQPADVGDHYGVMGGDGLLIVDIDDHTKLPPEVNLPPTFTTESPHGGEHRYYTVEEDPPGCDKDWGEVRTDGQLCLGPGSELDGCNKIGHNCGQSGEGRYVIQNDLPIAYIDMETLAKINPQKYGEFDSNAADTGGTATATVTIDLSEIETENVRLSTDEWQRLGMAFERDRGLKRLWDGSYRAVGFRLPDGGVDRSRAEYELAGRLRFWMQYGLPGDVDRMVYDAITIACRSSPETTGGERRKWIDHGHGNVERYRAETLARAVYDPLNGNIRTNGYTPPKPPTPVDGNGGRPLVSWPTICHVEHAVSDDGPLTTAGIQEHPAVGRSKRQIRRALEWLVEDGTIVSERDENDRRRWLHRMSDSPDTES